MAGASDRRAVAEQLGREPLVPFTVVARCGVGHPLVIRNHPVDPQGNPFPTLYWLTCTDAVKAVSTLEAEGWISRLDERAQTDPEWRTGLRRAHEEYAKERGRIVPGAQAWGGVGGTARGLKCLHAHFAYHLAGGDDVVGAWVAERVDVAALHYEKPSARVAAVDLGTNTIRLLVARLSEGEEGFAELARDMQVVRLGQGVDRTGTLAPEALRRTMTALERYCRRARALGATRIHLAATSAVRDASNRDELADAVLRLTGEPIEVLPGRAEAETTFLGATRGLDAERPVLVLDVGGGSTEFVLGDQRPQHALSAQIGSVRLTERYVHTDPPSYEELDRLDLAVTSVLHQVEDRMPVHEAKTLVAVAGTATTTQAIALGLAEYDAEAIHRSTLHRADAESVFRLLADMTTEERRAIPVMPRGREDVIVAGAAILVGVMQRWGFDRAIVSETDILDGLIHRMSAAGTRG